MSYELHSGTSHRAIGCEFNVTESTIMFKLGVFKQKNR